MSAHESLPYYIKLYEKKPTLFLPLNSFIVVLHLESCRNKGWGRWLMNSKAYSYSSVLCGKAHGSYKSDH